MSLSDTGTVSQSGEFTHSGETNTPREGHGTHTYLDGSHYTGEWKNGQKDGYGTLTYLDGSIYRGQWKGDQRDGEGTFKGAFASGDRSEEPFHIRKLPFQRMVKQIMCQTTLGHKSIRISSTAMECLQRAAEANFVEECAVEYAHWCIPGTTKTLMHIGSASVRTGAVEGSDGPDAQLATTEVVRKELSNSAIRRMAKQGGVKFISKRIYGEAHIVFGAFMRTLFRDSFISTVCAGRETITPKDVAYALTHHHGVMYTGQWKDGKRDGHGVYTYANGRTYTGQWKAGLRDGRGVLKFASGQQYDGEWKNDQREGWGVFQDSYNHRYEGEWAANMRDGQGAVTDSNGTHTGRWKSGSPAEADEPAETEPEVATEPSDYVGQRVCDPDTGQQRTVAEWKGRLTRNSADGFKAVSRFPEFSATPHTLFSGYVLLGNGSLAGSKRKSTRASHGSGKRVKA